MTYCKGHTLIEVMVTLLIFAFGMLGLTGLQFMALEGNHSAALRSQATALAIDMADRMRTNQNALLAGHYANAVADDKSCSSAHFGHRHTSPSSCDAYALAQDDLADWQAILKSSLPAGSGRVCLDGTPEDGTPSIPACDGLGEIYAVKVWWVEKQKNKNPVFVRLSLGVKR